MVYEHDYEVTIITEAETDEDALEQQGALLDNIAYDWRKTR